MKVSILLMMIMALALNLSAVSGHWSSSSYSRSGMWYRKHKHKKHRYSSSRRSSSKVRKHKRRYYQPMNYYKGKGGGGGGRNRGRGRGKGKGKGKGMFSHPDNSNVDQDELLPISAPTPAPSSILFVQPPVFGSPSNGQPTPAPIPTLFLPTVNGPTQAPVPKTGNGYPTLTPHPASAPNNNGSPTVDGPTDGGTPGTPSACQVFSPTGACLEPTSSPDIFDSSPEGNVDPNENEPICETTDGVYGSLEGESGTVGFGYELETTPMTEEEIIENILPYLEVEFNDLILPYIFPSTCDVRVLTRGRGRRLVIEGISARPDDEPISTDTVSCLLLSNPNSTCRVVWGGVTIFSTNYEESDSVKVREALKAVMDENTFESVDPRIRRVAYVEMLDNPDAPDPTDPIQDDKDLDGNNFNDSNNLLVGLVVAGAGGICIAAGAVTYQRSMRKENSSVIGGSALGVPGDSQMTPSYSVDTAEYAAEYQAQSTTESILDPEQDGAASVEEDLLDPPPEEQEPLSDGEDLLASTDHQPPPPQEEPTSSSTG